MNSNPANRFRPRLEELEDRTTPSGNIQAEVFDGVLYVGGDAASKSFEIDGTGSRSATIRVLDSDTTINGQSGPLDFGGIRKGFYITCGSGNDTVVLNGLNARDEIDLAGEGGNDVFKMIDSHAGKTSTIKTGDGNVQVIVQDSSIGRGFAVVGGAGDDYVELTDNRFRSAALNGGAGGTDTYEELGNGYAHGLSIVGFTVGPFQGNTSPTTPTTAPPPTITTTASHPTTLAAIPFTVTFSTNVTGFDQSKLLVTNGLASNFIAVSSTTYTFNITPAADGLVTVAIPAGAAVDSAGNASTAASFSITSLRTDAGMTNTMPDQSSPNFVASGNAGLKIWDVQPGSGVGPAVQANSTITVFYTGYLAADGTVFDSARTTGSPATFQLTNLIAGWQQGLIGMQAGDIRRLFIPSALGYGATGSPPKVPANADLIFEIKLLQVN